MVTPGHGDRVHRALTIAAVVCLVLTVAARTQKDRLIGLERILPEALQDPIQSDTTRPPLEFDYRGETYSVRPVADYELWGLVVSHNNPTAFYDIYHDRNSVDTLDLGVIWGENLTRDDYRRVKFRNVSFQLEWRYPAGTHLAVDAASNSHLITDSDEVRRQIAGVRVNDQIHLRGMLVDYSAASNPDWWRRTSTVRSDDGPGACEVVFVDELEILRRGKPVMHLVGDLGRWVVVGLLLAKAVWFFATMGGPRERKLLRRGALPPGA